MTLEQKAKEMRNAIDAVELALMGFDGLMELPSKFEGARDDLRVSVGATLRQWRMLVEATDECTRIINSPEFIPALLETDQNG